MVLGDEGIIAQAEKAKEAHEEAQANDVYEIESTQWRIPAAAGTHEYVTKEVDGVPIPKGFVYVGGTKDTGLIISDSAEDANSGETKATELKGNQFVWIPVKNNTLPMFTYDSSTGNYTAKLYDWDNWSGKGNPEEITGRTDGVQAEYNLMAKSVENYGGFYVGRYETGGFGTAQVESKAQQDDNTKYVVGTDALFGIITQASLYDEESDSVVSGMIYGSQWDAIMKWMKDIPNVNNEAKLFINYSSGMGRYWEQTPELTAQYSVRNIYDLAGCHAEYTQEIADGSYIVRGRFGKYWYGNASSRIARFDGTITTFVGSRLMFYIKCEE